MKLSPSDPRCLAPQLARVDTGPCPEDDPRRIEARAVHEAYSKVAPTPEVLDDLERRKLDRTVGVIRQHAPGLYVYTSGSQAFAVDARGARRWPS